MLVTLGSNATLSASGSQTFQYACNSAQTIFINCNDSSDSLDGYLTVQIGNDVVLNDISFQALSLISFVRSGGKSSAAATQFRVDIGSHVLDPLENLYVTLRNGDASNAMDAVDVSAIVNEGGIYAPMKWTNYTDSVFTDSNTVDVYAWADATLENDTTAFTIRNQSYSATPQVQSGVNVSLSQVQGNHDFAKLIGCMAHNQVPLDTSINYTSTTIDGVVCISAMPKSPSRAQASRKSGQAVLRAMTSSERKAL